MPTLKRTNPSINAPYSTGERSLLPTSSGRRQVIPTGTKVHPDAIDPNVAAMKHDAKAKGAQVLADLGNQAAGIFLQIDERLNRAEDDASHAEFSSKLGIGLNAINNELNTQDPSRGGFVAAARKQKADYARKLASGYSENSRPRLRAAINGTITKSLADDEIKFQNLTIKRRNDQVKARTIAANEARIAAAATADPEDVDDIKAAVSASYRQLAANGVISSSEAAKGIIGDRRKIDVSRLKVDARNLPIEALEASVEVGAYSEAPADQVASIMNTAYKAEETRQRKLDTARRRRQSENYGQALVKIATNKLTALDVKRMVAEKKVNGTQASKLLEKISHIEEGGGRGDIASYRALMSSIRSGKRVTQEEIRDGNVKGTYNDAQMKNAEEELARITVISRDPSYREAVSTINLQITGSSAGLISGLDSTASQKKASAVAGAMLELRNLVVMKNLTGPELIGEAIKISIRKNESLRDPDTNRAGLRLFRPDVKGLIELHQGGGIDGQTFKRQINLLEEALTKEGKVASAGSSAVPAVDGKAEVKRQIREWREEQERNAHLGEVPGVQSTGDKLLQEIE